MRDKENIGGALEGKVHIPRNFPQRDGALLVSAVMLLLVFVNVLLIISVISSQASYDDGFSGDYHRYEKDRMFITGFAGLALFYITTPVLFAGALNLFKGRKKLPRRSKPGMIVGFILFLILFFIMLVAKPIYFADSLEDMTVSGTHQLFTLLMDGFFLTSMFLLLFPHTTGKNRRTVLSGFIIIMIPLALFTLLSLMTGNDESFFLSSVPRYILGCFLYIVAGPGFFFSFRSLRKREGEIEPGGFIPGRPYQIDEADEGVYEEGSKDGAPLIREYDEQRHHTSSEDDETVKFILKELESGQKERKKGSGFFSMFTMKEDVPRRAHPRSSRVRSKKDSRRGERKW